MIVHINDGPDEWGVGATKDQKSSLTTALLSVMVKRAMRT